MLIPHYFPVLMKDPVLARAVNGREPVSVRRKNNVPLRLMNSIMGQQLSTKVAATLFQRFLALFPNGEPGPAEVVALPLETLRSIGLSNNKANYILNVARFCMENGLEDAVFETMTNEAIVELLTRIKGVGKWTVEMLLIFSLGREDVFSVDDLGIRTAMEKLYGLSGLPPKTAKAEMQRIAAQWSPFRSYACLHLWAWKDLPPGEAEIKDLVE